MLGQLWAVLEQRSAYSDSRGSVAPPSAARRTHLRFELEFDTPLSLYALRCKEADNIMDFGDLEPPYLPNNNVLRTAKEQEKNKDLGISLIDPIQSVTKMKYECHVGNIHNIGFDPFFDPLLDPRTNDNLLKKFL